MKKVLAACLAVAMLITMLPNFIFAASTAPLELVASISGSDVTIQLNTTESFEMSALDFDVIVPEGCTITTISKGADFSTTGAAEPAINGNKVSVLAAQWNSATVVPADVEFLTIAVDASGATDDALVFSINITAAADYDDNAYDWQNTSVTSNEVVMSGAPSIPTNEAYTADLSTSSGSAVKVGDTVTIDILVGGTTKEFASSELNLTYEGLTYVPGSSTVNGADVTAANGTIKIIDHGDSTSWAEGGNVTAYSLVFTVDAIAGESDTASVTLSNAALSTAANATGSDLAAATVTISTQTFEVTPADLTVDLSADFNGADSVVYGEDYTFTAKDPNYDYVITVTGGNEAVYDESTKTWTVVDVTSDLNITATKTAKKFSVSIDTETNFATVPVTGANAAAYMTDYTFTLKDNVAAGTGVSGWTYEVDKITIGGNEYTASSNGQTYTIAGSAITGDIVITTKKTEVEPGEYTVTVNRTEVSESELSVNPSSKVTSNGTITLTLNPIAGYSYTVTYKIGDGETQNVNWTNNSATISGVTGNVVITVSKAVDKNQITATVTEYLALNDKTMYLVQITSTLDSGYVYTYGGTQMYWSEKYNNGNGAYVFLVINNADDTLTVEEAKAAVSIAQGSVNDITVDYTGDVNKTGKIDANDAQLVWNMYIAKDYSDFTTVTIEKFLRADVDKNGKVDTNDAAEIVALVKTRQ